MTSIRNRLLLWLLSGLLLISGLAGIATYRQMLDEVNEMQDFELRQTAYAIAGASGLAALGMPAEGGHAVPATIPDFVVQVWNAAGQLQFSSHPGLVLPQAVTDGLSGVALGETSWRVFRLNSDGRIVQTAQSMADREDTAGDIVLRMFAPFLLLIPALAWLAWLAVNRGVAPLQRVTAGLALRDSHSLQPFVLDNVPEEVRPLIAALNDLLGRLEVALNAQRHFVADAAHELRTPLTALSLQAQLVQQAKDGGEREACMRDMRQGITRASHLVEQLLDLARQEPDSPRRLRRVDLSALLRDKAGEMALLAARKDIDFGVAAESEHWIDGDADALRLLVANLLDNAIRYTQSGGTVEAGVKAAGDRVVLTIRDNGPGIPPDEREQVFERFYRPAGQGASGSGLGLAIVRRVAESHAADIELAAGEGGRGCIFRVSFPAT